MIDIREYKNKIENKKPLILNVTNYVTMDFIANTLLALGASPLMSEESSDASELLNITDAIAINIGTVHSNFVQTALSIAEKNTKTKPLILDPVGIGASQIRTQTAQKLLPLCTVLRGNGSEVLALHNTSHIPKGVDSTIDSLNALSVAQTISKEQNIPISISGAIDYIVLNNSFYQCPYGSILMPRITGMGCALTAVIATFNTIEDDPFLATTIATAFYGICGELAEKRSQNSLGSFKNHFIDLIYQPDYDYIQQKINSLQLEKIRL